MTTVSGVIFLYSYDTTLASVSAIHLDEQGEVAKAAAMAMLNSLCFNCCSVNAYNNYKKNITIKPRHGGIT